jgi:phage terminase small subunit
VSHKHPGSGKVATAGRRSVFIAAYIANGQNATQAAISAGYSPKTAYSQGQRLLKVVDVSRQLAEAAKKVGEVAGLNAERTLTETARLSALDPARLFRADGTTLKNIPEMDVETRAAIASFEVDEIIVDGNVVGHTKKVKFWDKNRALDMSLRHLGLYERDNAQRGDSLVLQVALVGK